MDKMNIKQRIRKIEDRLRTLEGPPMETIEILGKDEKGLLIFGKRVPMEKAGPLTRKKCPNHTKKRVGQKRG